MEPLTTAAVAISSVLATKALEKTGEKVGETLWDQTSQFLDSLKKHSPETVEVIEKTPEQPLDYGQVVLEVAEVAKTHSEVAQAAQELEALPETHALPKFAEILREIEEAVKKSPHSYPGNFIQNIQKANNVAQTQTIDQRGSTFNF